MTASPPRRRDRTALREAGRRLVLTVDEAAAALGLRPPSGYALVRREGMPAIRIGRRVIVPTGPLREWAAAEGRTLDLPEEPAPPLPEILTLSDVAAILGISVGSAYRYASTGALPPPARPEKPYMVTRDGLLRWISQRGQAQESKGASDGD